MRSRALWELDEELLEEELLEELDEDEELLELLEEGREEWLLELCELELCCEEELWLWELWELEDWLGALCSACAA